MSMVYGPWPMLSFHGLAREIRTTEEMRQTTLEAFSKTFHSIYEQAKAWTFAFKALSYLVETRPLILAG